MNRFAVENYVIEVEKGGGGTHSPPTLPLTANCTIVPSPGSRNTAPTFSLRSRSVIGANEMGVSNARRVGGSDGRPEPTLSVFVLSLTRELPWIYIYTKIKYSLFSRKLRI